MSVMQKFRGAKPVEERNPFIGEGRHGLVLLKYRLFKSVQHGISVGCDFLVEKSARSASPEERAAGAPEIVPSHQPGSIVFKAWNINRGPKYVGDKCEDDINEANDFLMKLVGGTLEDGQRTAEHALDDQVDGPNQRRQPLRGMRIEVIGTKRITNKIDPKTNKNKEWMHLAWITAPQTPELIAQTRAHLDVAMPLASDAQAQYATQAAQPAPQAAAPMQPQYAAQVPQGTPAQPAPGSYPGYPAPAAPAQPSYPPQGYAPQPVGAPAPTQPAYPGLPPGVLPR